MFGRFNWKKKIVASNGDFDTVFKIGSLQFYTTLSSRTKWCRLCGLCRLCSGALNGCLDEGPEKAGTRLCAILPGPTLRNRAASAKGGARFLTVQKTTLEMDPWGPSTTVELI